MKQNEIQPIINNATSKSKAMIELYNGGLDIKQIAQAMDVRYNFVYNVISNHCRMNDIELRTNKGNENSKKVMIEKLFKEGKTNIEISNILWEEITNLMYIASGNSYKSSEESIQRQLGLVIYLFNKEFNLWN